MHTIYLYLLKGDLEYGIVCLTEVVNNGLMNKESCINATETCNTAILLAKWLGVTRSEDKSYEIT